MKVSKEKQALIGAYKRCFAGEDGQAVLNHLRKLANVDRAHILPGVDIDEKRLLYNEARRALVLSIMSAIDREFTEDSEQEIAFT